MFDDTPRATGVTVSILMPVYNTPGDVLDAAIRSVLSQTYPGWELCICDDASASPQTVRVLDKYRGLDPRIKICRSGRNLHIAGATNLAAEFATGEFIAFLDHDDTLEPDAIEAVAAAIEANPCADVLYTDEDKIGEKGAYCDPFFKPDWSPEHLASVMYLLHFFVLRKALFLELGGLRDRYSGAQDYDLALRATARARQVLHIPRVLYHWRMIEGSAAGNIDAKPKALLAGQAALADFVKGEGAGAEEGLFAGSFRVRWPLDSKKPVTLVILTNCRTRQVEGRGEILLVEHFVKSILAKTTYPAIRILVVDDGKMPARTRASLRSQGVTIKDYRFEGPFNFSRKVNHSLRFVETEDVILLNDDLEVISPGWVEALLEQSRRPGIGAAGARLLYPDGKIQHAGMVLGVHGGASHIFHLWPAKRIGYCGYTHLIRNYSAVTGAVLATRLSLVEEVGGFDETLAVDYNDVDFCLKLGAAGYRIVYTPYAELYHFENSSCQRGAPTASDLKTFLSRWPKVFEKDPFYSPDLPKDRGDCVLNDW